MDEDTSLDDFFAKKDKSKKKSKGKMTTATSEMLSHKEKHAKKQRQKMEKETEKQPGLTDRTSEEITATKENEEWQDFEEEKEKDYTGLRLQTLQINQDNNEDENEDENETNEENEEENTKVSRDMSQGPWKQPTQTTPAPAVIATPEPEKVKEETPKTGGKYIPPSMRGTAAQTVPSNTPSRRPVNKKSAPNISSEADFPTLGGSKTPVVQNTSDHIENPNQRGKLNLTLGNKFSALQK